MKISLALAALLIPTLAHGQGEPPAATAPTSAAADAVTPVPVAQPASPASATDAPAVPALVATGVAAVPAPEPKKKSHWYDKLSLRGYTQLRYNYVASEAGASAQYVGDSSIGAGQTLLIRRARLILSGDVSEHVSVYLQPDFASNVPGVSDGIQFAQVRDWYADLHVDKGKEFRFRVGASKVPYGFENMQSSQNRLPLDRADGTNSAVKNERDLGVFFYYTPKRVQAFLKHVVDDGLKGSGNYGMFALGAYVGQGGSLREQNDNLHVVARATLPFQLGNQEFEVSAQGYMGKYVVYASQISPLGNGALIRPAGTLEAGNKDGIRDMRAAASFIVYPKPFGFAAEWNIGRGPSLNGAQTLVTDRFLTGGYVLASYKYDSPCYGTIIPFARWSYYRGGYKTERNAPFVKINEIEAGVEWQIRPDIELVVDWLRTDRTNTSAKSTVDAESYGQFAGNVIRSQLQFKY